MVIAIWALALSILIFSIVFYYVMHALNGNIVKGIQILDRRIDQALERQMTRYLSNDEIKQRGRR